MIEIFDDCEPHLVSVRRKHCPVFTALCGRLRESSWIRALALMKADEASHASCDACLQIANDFRDLDTKEYKQLFRQHTGEE